MPGTVPKPLVIAIDGPSGVGKSTVARRLAERLGYVYVETGAMYRALALLALEQGVDLADAATMGKLAATADIRLEPYTAGNRLWLNGRDVTEAVRSQEVTRASSLVSVHAPVREKMVERQRELGFRGGVVMEGRDIGTRVFLDADLKIFLDASPEVRAERRFRDVADTGRSTEEVRREMAERDRRDQEREASPLVPAKDSIRLDSTSLSADEVVERILALAQQQLKESRATSSMANRPAET
ncbi:MAG: (d)CMP kinase [Acidobacteria bacterium]|nr:(d)CMP kinase [Acidobacteriota bacterium]